MPRTIDQIRASKLPSNMMQFAARGALQVPAAENIEILVYLALHNNVFGEPGAHDTGGVGRKSHLWPPPPIRKPPAKCWTTSSRPTICGRHCCPRCWKIPRSLKVKLVKAGDRSIAGVDPRHASKCTGSLHERSAARLSRRIRTWKKNRLSNCELFWPALRKSTPVGRGCCARSRAPSRAAGEAPEVRRQWIHGRRRRVGRRRSPCRIPQGACDRHRRRGRQALSGDRRNCELLGDDYFPVLD